MSKLSAENNLLIKTVSLLFPLKDFIFMFFALTSAIYLGGAGAVIIGGLYWKRGTAEAAWTALILGTVMARRHADSELLGDRAGTGAAEVLAGLAVGYCS